MLTPGDPFDKKAAGTHRRDPRFETPRARAAVCADGG
jgi:hypothetical protein